MSDKTTLKNIAKNLRRLLADNGISQNGLARDIEESPTRINQYVQGKKMPGAGVLSRIAERFSVTTDEIIGLRTAKQGGKKSA